MNFTVLNLVLSPDSRGLVSFEFNLGSPNGNIPGGRNLKLIPLFKPPTHYQLLATGGIGIKTFTAFYS